jgi:hypothetical protein
MQNLDEAYKMLDAFASVGARQFDVTFLDIDRAKRGFRKAQTIEQLRNSLPKLLPGLTERRNSIVVRPHANHVTLVQLDDLDTPALKRLESIAFLTLATSHGNHQAWVAVSTGSVSTEAQHTTYGAKDLSRRLRKGTGADISASGATRMAGTLNYKAKYEPDFPTVTLLSSFPGRIVKAEQLEELGLLAAREPDRPLLLRVSSSRTWPDYQRCVQGAPQNNARSGPDISRADFFFAMLSAQRGHNIDEMPPG